jgi:class 3 adenylate cyclase/tetratricopeptide (TPR) repeat protein
VTRSLNPHLAADRQCALSLGLTLPDRALGAAVFADIAGFTPLTNVLAAALGPRRGAEELTRHLNLVYDVLIDEVHRFGGSVVDFSGDAIMCWFDDDHPAGGGFGGSGDGTRRAVTAALALQEVMAQVADLAVPDGPAVHLALKVAVASGPVRRFAVGDPGLRRVDVLAGDTVARAAHAEQAARQGEVTLDASVVPVLGGDAVLSSWRPGAAGPVAVLASLTRPASPAPWSAVDSGIDAAEWVDHRLRERDEDASTELRSAVALFARFDGFDFDGDPHAGARLDTYVGWVQAVLGVHDGHLLQVTIGDKGSYLYMAFGAPTAHEDLVDRSLATALELRAAPTAATGLPGPPAMGIDQGIARVGAYGGQARRTYGVLGDAVNLAARLMASAGPGEILVTHAVRAASRQRLVFDDLGPLTVKGHAQPVTVARLVGRPSGTGSIAYGPLVGRADELGRLTAALADAARGRGGALVVEGEPGVGKSHLVDAARRWLADHHEVTWLAAGHDDGRRGSLAPFLPLLRDLFYLELADDDASRRALLEHGIDSRLAELRGLGTQLATATADGIDAARSFLAALLGVRWPGSPFEEHEPDTRVARGLQAVDRYLCGESLLRPLVVHVRDAHELDEDSRRLIELLVGSAEELPICVLMDRRADPGGPAVKPDRTIVVGPFGADDVADLVEAILGSPAGIELCEHLLLRTGGNALFIEQLVVDLHQRGALVPQPAGWSLAAPVRLDLPVTLNAVLVSRLDHLDPAVRRAAAAASVLGEVFAPGVLAAMGGWTDGGAAAVLAAGEAAGVWSRTVDGRWRFRHALLRDAAYGMQLDDALRLQHRRAAQAIVAGRGRAATAAETAWHYAEAGASGRAAADHRRAARQAAAAARLRDAVLHYEAALAQASKAGCAAAVTTGLRAATAEVAAALGDHATAVAHLSAGLDGAGLDGGDLGAGEAVVWRTRRGESLHRLGRTAEAEADYEAALVALQEAPEIEMASRIYAGLATVHGQVGQLEEALELAEMALRLAGSDEGEGRARQRLAQIQWRRGAYAESLAHARAALDCCRRTGDSRALPVVCNNIGLALAALGDTEAAVVAFGEAVDGFERSGSEHGLAGALDNLAQLCARRGDGDAAMLHLERAVGILARIGMAPDGVISAMWQGGSW